MRLLLYAILALTLWRFPAFALQVSGGGIGSLLSYLMFVLLLAYYFFSKKNTILFPFLILGVSYFLIAGLINLPDFNDFVNKFLKYLIFIVCTTEVIRNSTKNEVFYFLLIGGLSILVNALFFKDNYGRYSGFYLNPNSAGFLALIGYSFCYCLSDKKLKTIGLITFTIAGFLTLSRYFFLMWFLINIIAVYTNKANAVFFGLGFLTIILVVGAASMLQLNTMRFSIVQNVLGNEIQSGVDFIESNSRLNNWSNYYNMIFNKPFFGNGYLALSGGEIVGEQVGVHNSYLMIIGESGIIPFFTLIAIYFKLLWNTLLKVKKHAYLLMITLTIIGFLFVSHNYFDNYELLFFSLWVYIYCQMDDETQENTQLDIA